MNRQAAKPAFGPGLYGKLPARGDYISRALPPSFLTPWEEWLHGVWRVGVKRFGEVWAPLVGDGPTWRFVLDEEVCGPNAVAGVLAPGIDRVGRIFPLSLAVALPAGTDPAALPITAGAWFNRAEALLRRARAPELDFEIVEQWLEELGPPERPPLPALSPGSAGWHIALDQAQAPALAYPALFHDLAATFSGQPSLWWSTGCRQVRPSMVVCQGLPDAGAVTAFYDGAWDYWGWNDADAAFPEGE
ncbi:MAG: type VI secretion system-associated protein TagF [Rhodospirillaceae bacterium]